MPTVINDHFLFYSPLHTLKIGWGRKGTGHRRSQDYEESGLSKHGVDPLNVCGLIYAGGEDFVDVQKQINSF